MVGKIKEDSCGVKCLVGKVFAVSVVVFIFNFVLGYLWYSPVMFGDTWMSTIINKPIYIESTSYLFPIIVTVFSSFLASFISVHIFAMYTHRVKVIEATLIRKVFYSIVRLPFLLTVLYFAVSLSNVAFDIYTLKHLFIDTGYILAWLCFSCITVVLLFKD